ncbi:MAG: SIR2 family protein [Tepidisphaeraceae bacterium]
MANPSDRTPSCEMLVERVAQHVRDGRRVCFLFGSALTVTPTKGSPGVPSVAELASLARKAAGLPSRSSKSDSALHYQECFAHLIAARGQDVANEVVRGAIMRSRTIDAERIRQRRSRKSPSESECAAAQADTFGWHLSKHLEALADLLVRFPSIIGRNVLTTNFDPLIEVACANAGGSAFSVALQNDGALPITHSLGTRVIHLHGFWLGSDTANAVVQVAQERQRLTRSLTRLLDDVLLVVIGYGGWDDCMMRALSKFVVDPHAKPDIAWAFYSRTPEVARQHHPLVFDYLKPGLERGRANLYYDCDIARFLVDLRDRIVRRPRSTESSLSTFGPLPAESLQIFCDVIDRRFFVNSVRRRSQGSAGDLDIGEATQSLSTWGPHLPVTAALAAALRVVHWYERSFPHLNREPDFSRQEYWPRRCLLQASQWLSVGEPVPEDEWQMWPSVWYHCSTGRTELDRTIVRAVQYACEAVALFRGKTIPTEPDATSLVRAGQAVHCVMRVVGDDRLSVWNAIRSSVARLRDWRPRPQQ